MSYSRVSLLSSSCERSTATSGYRSSNYMYEMCGMIIAVPIPSHFRGIIPIPILYTWKPRKYSVMHSKQKLPTSTISITPILIIVLRHYYLSFVSHLSVNYVHCSAVTACCYHAMPKQNSFYTHTTAGAARQPYLQLQRNRLPADCFTVILSSPMEIFEHENENLTEHR